MLERIRFGLAMRRYAPELRRDRDAVREARRAAEEAIEAPVYDEAVVKARLADARRAVNAQQIAPAQRAGRCAGHAERAIARKTGARRNGGKWPGLPALKDLPPVGTEPTALCHRSSNLLPWGRVLCYLTGPTIHLGQFQPLAKCAYPNRVFARSLREQFEGGYICRNPKKSEPRSRAFLTDVKTLRARARQNLATGNITDTYQGDAKKTIEILQSVLATEIVCVLRYTMHAIAATGISSEGVKDEFAQHAKEEQGHMMEVAERIHTSLAAPPNFNPEGLVSASASQYVEGTTWSR